MKYLLRFLILFPILQACVHSSKAPTSDAPKPRTVSTDVRTQKDYFQLEYKDLSAIMNITMLTVDGDEYGCKIPADQVPAISQMLRASLDERFAADKEAYRKKSTRARMEFFPKNCVVDCSCSAYSSFFDYLVQDGIILSQAEKRLQQKLLKDLEIQSKNPHVCAEQQSWVCDSKSFQYLYAVE